MNKAKDRENKYFQTFIYKESLTTMDNGIQRSLMLALWGPWYMRTQRTLLYFNEKRKGGLNKFNVRGQRNSLYEFGNII